MRITPADAGTGATLQPGRPAGDELREVLQAVLGAAASPSTRIDALERQRSPYEASAALEELDVVLGDGRRLAMMFKDASRDAMGESARRAKPAAVHHPLREIEMYRQVLAPRALGTAHWYGAAIDEEAGRYWLFLEDVPGVELYQEGDVAVWQEVAGWLARMHLALAADATGRAADVHALWYDRAYCRFWLERARAFFAGSGRHTSGLERLAARHDWIVERLAALPQTVIHGEFYASNVLVHRTESGIRVCPVDWEMAAVGPGVIDLAALTAGTWSETDRTCIIRSYYDVMNDATHGSEPFEEFMTDLACARMQTAIQWLGWFGRRRPPAAHARDWLGDALEDLERLGA